MKLDEITSVASSDDCIAFSSASGNVCIQNVEDIMENRPHIFESIICCETRVSQLDWRVGELAIAGRGLLAIYDVEAQRLSNLF